MTEVTYLPGMTDIPTTLRRLSEEDIEQALIMFVQDGSLFAYKILPTGGGILRGVSEDE